MCSIRQAFLLRIFNRVGLPLTYFIRSNFVFLFHKWKLFLRLVASFYGTGACFLRFSKLTQFTFTSAAQLARQVVTVHSHTVPEIPKRTKKKNKLPFRDTITYNSMLRKSKYTFVYKNYNLNCPSEDCRQLIKHDNVNFMGQNKGCFCSIFPAKQTCLLTAENVTRLMYGDLFRIF